MACILHIETSTDVCSVALSEDGAVLFSKEDFNGPQHAVTLGVFIDEVLSMADSHAKLIDAVAVSCGPGICYGRNIPLIALPTLKVLSVPILLMDELPEDALLCPMIDARRMEVYSAIYDRALNPVKEVSADIIDSNSYTEYLNDHPVYFFGNGASKCKEVIKHPNARFIDDIQPLARWMFPLADRQFLNKEFQDVAYFEPFYLKEFVATIAKNKVL